MKQLQLVGGIVTVGLLAYSFVFAQSSSYDYQIQGATPTPSLSVPPASPIPLDAACVGMMSVSRTVDIGSSFNALITVKNIGTTTWNKSEGFALGSQDPQDNNVWGIGRGQLQVNSVAPGATADIKLALTAPVTPGDYTFRWRMLKEGVAWFGDTCSPKGDGKIKVIIPPNSAGLAAIDVPTSLLAGQQFEATITMNNNSRRTWSNMRNTRLSQGPYGLGSQGPQDNTIWGTNRAEFNASGDVLPSQRGIFKIRATAPTTLGSQTFKWQMVEEGAQWFGPIISRAITVKPVDFACTQTTSRPSLGQTVTFQCPNVPSSMTGLSWKATGGTPAAGTGASFTTSYATAGTKSVVLTYKNGRTKKSNTYLVYVQPTSTPTTPPTPTPTQTPTSTITPTPLPSTPTPTPTPTVTPNGNITLTAEFTSPLPNTRFTKGQRVPITVVAHQEGSSSDLCGTWELVKPNGQVVKLTLSDFESDVSPRVIPPCIVSSY